MKAPAEPLTPGKPQTPTPHALAATARRPDALVVFLLLAAGEIFFLLDQPVLAVASAVPWPLGLFRFADVVVGVRVGVGVAAAGVVIVFRSRRL